MVVPLEGTSRIILRVTPRVQWASFLDYVYILWACQVIKTTSEAKVSFVMEIPIGRLIDCLLVLKVKSIDIGNFSCPKVNHQSVSFLWNLNWSDLICHLFPRIVCVTPFDWHRLIFQLLLLLVPETYRPSKRGLKAVTRTLVFAEIILIDPHQRTGSSLRIITGPLFVHCHQPTDQGNELPTTCNYCLNSLGEGGEPT